MTVDATHTIRQPNEQWTVRKVIQWTTAHLKKHGSETPRLDAELLLAHARNCPRIALYTHFDDPLTDQERGIMRELVQRRAQSEPVAYLIGRREFYGLDFHVTPNVLIPRPDTETLVMEALELIKGHPEPRILDLGTGSGCIAIAIAVHHPNSRLTAVDQSASALEVARENAEAHSVSDRIQFLQGDLFEPISLSEQFDLIVSNPPYVTEREMETLPPDVRLHEPPSALAAGPDGLDVLKRIVTNAPAHLLDGGHLAVEIGEQQGESVRSLMEAAAQYDRLEILKDLAGHGRVVRARKLPSS